MNNHEKAVNFYEDPISITFGQPSVPSKVCTLVDVRLRQRARRDPCNPCNRPGARPWYEELPGAKDGEA